MFCFILMVSPAAAKLNGNAAMIICTGLSIERLGEALTSPDIETRQRKNDGRRSDVAFDLTAPLR